MIKRSDVPSYFVYGEPARALDVGFLHFETVMERENVHFGRVTPHKHPQMGQITFWFRGQGRYLIEDETWTFSAPAVSFVPGDVVHGFDVDADSDAYVVSVSNDVLSALAADTALDVGVPVFVNSQTGNPVWARLRIMLEVIGDEYRERGAENEKLLKSLIAGALSFIRQLGGQTAVPAAGPRMQLALTLRRAVDQHFREDWTVAAYVEALATTPHLLNEASLAVFGKSVKELVMERRMLEAKRLLMFTIRPVEDIGRAIGIEDPAYFSRFFRRRAGEAPAAWRRRHPYAR